MKRCAVQGSKEGGMRRGAGLNKGRRGALTKRWALKAAVCIALWVIMSLTLYAATIELYDLQISYQKIDLTGGESVKLRLVLISDLHAQSEASSGFLSRVVEGINKIGPDYTIIAGDLVDDKAEYVQFLSPLLGLDRNKTIILLGNHDYGPDWSDERVAERVAAWARGNGFTVLRNGDLKFSAGGKDFCIIGADSLWAKRIDLEKAFKGVDDECTKILAVHEPDAALELGSQKADLILAGHTHGGQVCIPFIGPFKNSKAIDDDCVAGWYDIGGIPLYVTRGIGQSLPIRFNAKPELTVMDIT